MNINIIGFGVVGQAVYASIISSARKQVKIYDMYDKRFGPLTRSTASSLIKDDVIFICVDTPTTGIGQNANSLKEILKTLKDIKFPGLIIIKSTVLYDNISEYLNTDLNIVYNPEFLSANHSVDDFQKQNYIVLGGSSDLTCWAMQIYEDWFEFYDSTKEYELCSIKEAIDFKYMRNMYQAYKVLFWEFVQDTTGNARKMSYMLDRIPIGENSQVGLDGSRGFGGACLPKDLKALAMSFDKLPTTLSYMLDYNEEIKDRR